MFIWLDILKINQNAFFFLLNVGTKPFSWTPRTRCFLYCGTRWRLSPLKLLIVRILLILWESLRDPGSRPLSSLHLFSECSAHRTSSIAFVPLIPPISSLDIGCPLILCFYLYSDPVTEIVLDVVGYRRLLLCSVGLCGRLLFFFAFFLLLFGHLLYYLL